MVNTLSHANSTFFHSKNKAASWVFLIVLSNLFFLQKHRKRSSIDTLEDLMTMQNLKGTFDHSIPTTGEGEE
ncbi:MAG TPA: hypothetical protein VN377_05840 [Candidatus Thermoplasmatota archaeon]|nr:hypothetical protein [Candidatus Thermoplasmatota archaeon]